MTFEPVPLKYALSGSAFVGTLNAVPTLIALLALNILGASRTERLGLGADAVVALLIGVLGTCLTTLLNRREQTRQQKTMPYGAMVAVAELTGMTAAGAVLTPLFGMEPRFLWIGALSGLVGSLPRFLVMSPWKKTESEADFQDRNQAFGQMTREAAQEYKEELGDRQRSRLRKKHGDPWEQSSNQGWWR